MKTQLIGFSKITALAIGKWFVATGIGIFFTIVSLIVAFCNYNGLPDDSPQSFYVLLFKTYPAICLLIFGSPFFIWAYIFSANKIAVSTAIYETWNRKAGPFLLEKAKVVFDRVIHGNKVAHKAVTSVELRLQLLESNRRDPQTSWIAKKILGYFFRSIQLHDVDLHAADAKLSGILSQKLDNFILDAAMPSWLLFQFVFALQIALLVWSFF